MNKKLNEIKKKFVWGPIVDIHEIGDYQIIEYNPQIFNKCTGTGKYDYNRTQFHPYINYNDTSHSYKTLDEALIGTIALKHDGLNSQAAYYFYKMIGIGDEQNENRK